MKQANRDRERRLAEALRANLRKRKVRLRSPEDAEKAEPHPSDSVPS